MWVELACVKRVQPMLRWRKHVCMLFPRRMIGRIASSVTRDPHPADEQVERKLKETIRQR